jgi:hypothetical protein
VRDPVVAAEVLTVNVEVPEPAGNEDGLKEHVGPRGFAGATLQVRLTLPLNPPLAPITTGDVAVPPAETVAGDKAEAERVKSGGAGVTVRPTVAL